MSRDGALHVVKKAARRAGIEKRVWSHQFRHSRATYLLANGMTEAQVKALLGWSPGSTMLSRYSHTASRDAYRSLLALSGLEPEPVTIERLHFDDDRLRPAVPMLAPPGAATPRLGAVDPALLEALVQVELPKAVNREVRALLNEHAENERALIAEVHRLRSEIEELRGGVRGNRHPSARTTRLGAIQCTFQLPGSLDLRTSNDPFNPFMMSRHKQIRRFECDRIRTNSGSSWAFPLGPETGDSSDGKPQFGARWKVLDLRITQLVRR
jgi:hypothetical protein